MPTPSSTPSLDLPQSIKNVFDAAAGIATGGEQAGLDPSKVNGYAEGGLVTEGGGTPPVDAGLGAEGGMGLTDPNAEAAPAADMNIEAEAKRLIRENPEVAAEMLQIAEDAMEMGEFTEEMIVQGGKMAIVVARNPDMYPKMQKRLLAMGIQAEEMPAEYDPEFIMTVIMMYLAWQDKDRIRAGGASASGGSAPAPTAAPPPEPQNFAKGGLVTHGSTSEVGGKVVGMGGPKDDMINANLSNGEFVIPADAVREHGVAHFKKRYVEPFAGKSEA